MEPKLKLSMVLVEKLDSFQSTITNKLSLALIKKCAIYVKGAFKTMNSMASDVNSLTLDNPSLDGLAMSNYTDTDTFKIQTVNDSEAFL